MGCCQKKRKEDNLIEKTEEEYQIQVKTEKIINVEPRTEMQNDNAKISYNDFEPLKLLGTGSFGRVLLARLKKNSKLYAMKILNKTYLKKKHQEEHTRTERDLMVSINSPFIVNIKFAFQDDKKLFLVTEFMQGGDMFFHLHEEGIQFSEERVKFYTIEILLAIEFLHKNNMVYRDLKPENILMDSIGHIKITDFGLSKILDDINDKVFTLCGTPQYLAPEIIKKKGYDKNIDWWSLGVLMYEMSTGELPFYIPKGVPLNHKIFEKKIKYPDDMDKNAKDLISKLLVTDPNKRLGTGNDDAISVKSHPYFNDVDWDKYLKKEITPPFKPRLKNELDLRYFDRMFTDEPIDSERKTISSRSRVGSDYNGFTYTTDSVAKELGKLGRKDRISIGSNDNYDEDE